MLRWGAIGILPEDLFQIARLAIDQPLLQVLQVDWITQEPLC